MPEYEWGVQYKTFTDGPHDRLLTEQNSRKYTEDQAREEVASMMRGYARADPRVVRREVSHWEPA